MKPRHLALGAALVVAAGFALFGDKSPSAELVEAAPRKPARVAPAPAAAASTARSAATPAATVEVVALVPRDALMAQGVEQGTAAASVFAVQNWTPPPPPPPKPPPPPAPTAPPLPFVYLGKALENGAWDVFLARGSETLIVRKAMVLDGVYRVDAIAPPSMTLTYLPLQQVQQLNIGVPE